MREFPQEPQSNLQMITYSNFKGGSGVCVFAHPFSSGNASSVHYIPKKKKKKKLFSLESIIILVKLISNEISIPCYEYVYKGWSWCFRALTCQFVIASRTPKQNKTNKKTHPVHTKTTYPKNTCSIWGKKKSTCIIVEIKDVPGN